MDIPPFLPIIILYMLNWNIIFTFIYTKLNLNWVLWSNSQTYRWYIGSGVPIILVHQILCTELIGVKVWMFNFWGPSTSSRRYAHSGAKKNIVNPFENIWWIIFKTITNLYTYISGEVRGNFPRFCKCLRYSKYGFSRFLNFLDAKNYQHSQKVTNGAWWWWKIYMLYYL